MLKLDKYTTEYLHSNFLTNGTDKTRPLPDS